MVGGPGKFQGNGPSVNHTASEIDIPAKSRGEREANVDLEEKHTRNEKIGEKVQLGTDFKTHGQGATDAYGGIVFVRSRMFYARPAYNNRGQVRFGLRHIRMFMLTIVLCIYFFAESSVAVVPLQTFSTVSRTTLPERAIS